MTKAQTIYLNLTQGLLIDPTQSDKSVSKVIGAFNFNTKKYWLREGTPHTYTLPELLDDYELEGSAGHFEVSYWDFDANGMLPVK
jgi:hypothetical protein